MAEFNHLDTTVQERYKVLEALRTNVLTRAEDNAKLTLPSVFPLNSIDDNVVLDSVYQSLGARGVLNLASKIVLALFPVTQPFFKLEPNAELEAEILLSGDTTLLDEVTQQLVKIETGVQHEMDRQRIRTPLNEAIKQLIVSGNACLWATEDQMSILSVRDFVVERDASGNILDFIAQEKMSPRSLPQDIKVLDDKAESVTLYTRMVLDVEGDYQVYQELEEQIIKGTEQTFKKDDVLPFIVLRWDALPNTSYGRGYVEYFIGDLRNFESMNMVITDIASIMSRTIFMVNPNTQYGTDIDDLNNAITGDYIAGHADDITVPQTNKTSDLSVLMQFSQVLETRLSLAFMLFQSRDAERVTKFEQQLQAQQLEETLGGVYSLLADELQRPLLSSFMNLKQFKGLADKIEAVVVTGLDALGRGHDANKLLQLVETLNSIPESWGEVHVGTLVKRLAYSLGVEVDGLIKTIEEKQQEAQANQEALAEQGLISSAVNQGGANMANVAIPQEQGE